MSDTIEQPAATTATSPSHPTIEEMLARIDREAGERAPALHGFARALLRRLADDDLAEVTAEELFALATSASSTPIRRPTDTDATAR